MEIAFILAEIRDNGWHYPFDLAMMAEGGIRNHAPWLCNEADEVISPWPNAAPCPRILF
jgi:hypothetical protein